MSNISSTLELPRALSFLCALYVLTTIFLSYGPFTRAYRLVLSLLRQPQNPLRTWLVVRVPYKFRSDTELSSGVLCQRCKITIMGSRLLLGSPLHVVRRSEYREHYPSLAHLEHSTDGFCHLCSLLWHSVGRQKRALIISEDRKLDMQLWQPVDMAYQSGQGRSYFPARFAFEVKHRYAARRHLAQKQQLRLKMWAQDAAPHPLRLQVFRGSEPIGCVGVICEDTSLPDCEAYQVRLAHSSQSTSSKYHFEIAKTWIRDCISLHDQCRQRPRSQGVPTRLVCVDSWHDMPVARLHIVSEHDKNLEYLTLSHRWGGAKILTLNAKNFQALQEEISWYQLPKTFQDAFIITRSLGYSYIWIDSLCILQDSKTDWAKESALMGEIYAGSSCTIAATGSIDSNDGCFKDRDIRGFIDCKVVDRAAGGGLRLCMCESLETSFESQVNASPLNARAWVFQERLLSTRIIHFASKMIFWECQTCIITEQHPYSPIRRKLEVDELQTNETDMRLEAIESQYTTAHKDGSSSRSEDSSKTMEDYRSAFEFLKRSSPHEADHIRQHKLTRCWYELVTKYTLGGLTKEEDKLVAISGIAAEIQSQTGMIYLAGLWKEMLIYNLLWFVQTPAKHVMVAYRAPSWSWASLDGKITYEQDEDASSIRFTTLASLTSVDIKPDPKSDSNTEVISSGSIELDCVLRKMRLKGSIEHDVRTGIIYGLQDEVCELVGRFYPDFLSELQHHAMFCLPLIRLSRTCKLYNVVQEQTRGLVLKFDNPRSNRRVYRRIGYFSGKIMNYGSDGSYNYGLGEREVVTII